jgi:hypothetical protein
MSIPCILTLILLTWRIWWAFNNTSRWQMGFNSVFKGLINVYCCGPGSVVGIATGYELDGPGIESRWGRDFPHLSRPALGSTQPVQWVPGLSLGAAEAWRWPLTPFYSRGHERVELYLYSPYGPYGLYRASVPVQGCTLPYSRAIPILSLWAVRPVESLSACTRVHFTFTLLLYQHMHK